MKLIWIDYYYYYSILYYSKVEFICLYIFVLLIYLIFDYIK
jgi:hypothetical protein